MDLCVMKNISTVSLIKTKKQNIVKSSEVMKINKYYNLF